MKTALIIIDIQNDYFPNGRMELEGSIDAGRRAGMVLARFRKRELPVLLILVFLSCREDFFGNWLPDLGLVAPEAWKPGATSGSPA